MSTKDESGPAFPVNEDALLRNLPGMTLRQYAAIKLRVPDSGTDWLDDMIRKSLRIDMASMAMQGLLAGNARFSPREDSAYLLDVADKMMAAHGATK